MYFIYYFILTFIPLLLWTGEVNESSKQILNINLSNGSPKVIHPHYIRDSDTTTLVKAIFEGLTRINLKGKVELALAEKIETSICKTKYNIFLRDSKWSNGEKVTASHFVEAWKAAINPETKCSAPYRFFIIKNAKKVFMRKLPMKNVGIYAINNKQIEVHLEHPAFYFEQLLADPVFSPVFDLSSRKNTVFNGPFLTGTFNPGKRVNLVKNPLYWDVDNVKLDQIEIFEVADASSAYKLYQEGKLDFIGSPFCDLTEEILQNTKDVKSSSTCAAYWANLNVKSPRLSSKAIRKALNLSIDRDYISKHVLSNANPNHSILPQELSFINKKFTKKSLNQIQKIFAKGLKELGYKRKNFHLTISYTATPRHANLAKYLKYQWEKIFGIKVILNKSDWNTFFTNINSFNYEIGGMAKYTTYLDSLYFLEYFYDNQMNRSQWENSDFKKLIDFANNAVTEKERKEYLTKAEKILEREVPVIPIYTHKHLYLCRSNLVNFYPSKLLYQDFKWAYFK